MINPIFNIAIYSVEYLDEFLGLIDNSGSVFYGLDGIAFVDFINVDVSYFYMNGNNLIDATYSISDFKCFLSKFDPMYSIGDDPEYFLNWVAPLEGFVIKDLHDFHIKRADFLVLNFDDSRGVPSMLLVANNKTISFDCNGTLHHYLNNELEITK